MTAAQSNLELAQACVRFARDAAVGSDCRKRWLAEARNYFTQYKNCLAHRPMTVNYRNITPAQVKMLTRALTETVPADRQRRRVATNLAASGLGEYRGNQFSVNANGVLVLKDYRSVRYANGGSMAQLLDLQAVEAAYRALVTA